MPIAIFFRAQRIPNNFRESLLYLIEDAELDAIVLTYPYYSEKKLNGDGEPSNYSILDRGLKERILSREKYELITIAPRTIDKNDEEDSWTKSYRNFVANLRNYIEDANKNIDYHGYFLMNENNFLHAKFCLGYKIIEEKYVPVVLLLGSSNLTNKAFDEYPDYNYESDILLWDDNYYTFKLDTLKDGDLRPILAKPKNKDDERIYLKYFHNKVSNEFNDNKLEEVK